MEHTDTERAAPGGQYVELDVRINDELGLHARPAAKLAQAAQQFQAEITLVAQDASADAKSILDILALAATRGTHLTLRCAGPDASQAAEALSSLFFQE